MRHQRSNARILNKTDIPVPGEHYGVPSKPYVYRGKSRTLGTCAKHKGFHVKAKPCLHWKEVD